MIDGDRAHLNNELLLIRRNGLECLLDDATSVHL